MLQGSTKFQESEDVQAGRQEGDDQIMSRTQG